MHIVEGGPSVNVPQLLAGGAADFGIGSNGFIPLNMLRQGVPIKAVMAVFQKDPQVLITHPRADVKSLAEMKGKPIMIADASTVAFWPWLKAKYGFADTQIRKYTFNLAPFLVDPKAIQEGYLTSEPYTIEQQGHFKPQVFLLADNGYPGYANMVVVPQKWIATNPAAVQAFVDATRDGWKSLSLRQSRARQCADQARQSRHDGRADRAGHRQDEKLRHRDVGRCDDNRHRRHDRRALEDILRHDGVGRALSTSRCLTGMPTTSGS